MRKWNTGLRIHSKVGRRLYKAWQQAIDAIQPRQCRLCDQVTEGSVCAACYAELPHQQQSCAQCALSLTQHDLEEGAKPDKVGLICGECLAHPPSFVQALAPFRYQAPLIPLISRFKYQGALSDGRLLGTWLGDYVQAQGDMVDLIIPVPLHASRLRQRGFNQSAELAHWVSRIVQVPWRADVLRRIKVGSEQQGLSRTARRRNMQGVFQVVKKPAVTTVALVDDVMTTGTTVGAAAHCLRQAGVSRVVVWVVARTPKPGMR